MKIWKHLCTINHHKMLVMKGCFQVGLYWQGLLHDMSKYSPVEFWNGCRFYQGTESPNNQERRVKGYSAAWLHHKGRNKHHMEYWIDYGMTGDRNMCGMKMPLRYVVEMVIDRVSASKNYLREDFKDSSPLEYYEKSKDHYIIHPETNALLSKLLHMYAEKGEKETYRYIREILLKQKDY